LKGILESRMKMRSFDGKNSHWTQLSFKQYFNKNYFIHFFYNYVMVLVFGNYELQLCTHFTVCLLFFLYFMEYILNLVI
jgi:hypothetical protein